jgi:hypothetical protein
MTMLRMLTLLVGLSVSGPLSAETLTLPQSQRPEWLRRDGIVMAGSWEPLMFRVRRDGKGDYTPTAEQLAAYRREQSPEMVARLKAMGVNFVMTHCYKGAGLVAERESMADAVRFARLCHDADLRVGVYNFSGAFLWEPFFKEMPQARDWVVRRPDGKPVTYGTAAYRYYWNRNHPAAEAFYQNLVRFAVNEIQTDLVHFDNYVIGPGYDANSVERFREYLRRTFTADQLAEMGVRDVQQVQPPGKEAPAMLVRAWQVFCTRSLAESYHRLNRYARSLRTDVLVECNPGGVRDAIRPPVDHGQILQGGEAYWVESGRIGYRDGKLVSRIRNYKVGRALNNMTFDYTLTPLEMAESMAFNLDCLGCVCWFEYGQIVAMPGSSEPMSPLLKSSIRFYHQRRDLFRDAQVVADVAVLRSSPSQAFGGPKCSRLTARIEDWLIENRVCFHILHDHQLGDLRRYRALVLAGCVAMGDRELEQVRKYVATGGRLCVVGPLATHDEWMRPRPKPALDDLPQHAVARVEETGDPLSGIQQACEDQFSLSVTAAKPDALAGLCTELTEQPNRRLVHLVNYRTDSPARNIAITVRHGLGPQVKAVRLVSPERANDRPVSFAEAPGLVRFTVPEIGTYEIAVIEFAEL